jgi:hypothetical protein
MTLKQLLTVNQFEVVKLIAFGYSNKDVAQRLGITRFGVQDHLREIYFSLGIVDPGVAKISNRLKLAVRFAEERKLELYEICKDTPTPQPIDTGMREAARSRPSRSSCALDMERLFHSRSNLPGLSRNGPGRTLFSRVIQSRCFSR